MKKIIMKNMLKYVCICALIAATGIFTTGCEKENLKNNITNVKWHLTKFVDVANDNTENTNTSEKTLWVSFYSDNSINGWGMGNQLGGTFECNANNISIHIGPLTEVGDFNGLETKMCDALNKAGVVKQKGETLLLYYNGKKNYLQFEKVTE